MSGCAVKDKRGEVVFDVWSSERRVWVRAPVTSFGVLGWNECRPLVRCRDKKREQALVARIDASVRTGCGDLS